MTNLHNTYSGFNCTGYAIHSGIMRHYTMMTTSKLKKKLMITFDYRGGGGGGEIKIKF